jgi:hypothetical protein
VDEPQGKRVTGYVEFSINDKTIIRDAVNYFQIFFHFNARLASMRFPHEIKFDWDLEGANFFEKQCKGYTCAVIINTGYNQTTSEARQVWSAALSGLAQHLEEIKDAGFDRIY